MNVLRFQRILWFVLLAGCIRYEVKKVNPNPKHRHVILDREKSKAVEEIASIRRIPDPELTDSLYDISVDTVLEGPGETRDTMEVQLSKRIWSPLHIPLAIVGTAVYTTVIVLLSPLTISKNGFDGFSDLFIGKRSDCPSGIWVGATYNSIGIVNGDAELFDLCRTLQSTEEVVSHRGDQLRSKVFSHEPELDLVLNYKADSLEKTAKFPFQTNIEAGTATQNLIEVFSALAAEKKKLSGVVISVMHQGKNLHELPLTPAKLDLHLKPYRHAMAAKKALAAGRSEEAVDAYLAAYASIADFRSESFIWYSLLESFKRSKRVYASFTMPKFDLYPRDRFDPGPEVDTSGWIISPSAYQLVKQYPLDIRVWYYIAQSSNGGGAFSDRVQQLSLALAAK